MSSRARATATNNDIMVQPRQIRDNLISSHAFIYWIEAVVEAIEAALCIYIVCCSMMKYHLQCNWHREKWKWIRNRIVAREMYLLQFDIRRNQISGITRRRVILLDYITNGLIWLIELGCRNIQRSKLTAPLINQISSLFSRDCCHLHCNRIQMKGPTRKHCSWRSQPIY